MRDGRHLRPRAKRQLRNGSSRAVQIAPAPGAILLPNRVFQRNNPIPATRE
jgi:hypothetical protein